MKANNLKIGQKYTWRRNSQTTIEVTYLGCYDVMYEFEYMRDNNKMQTVLSMHHVDSDISEPEYKYTLTANHHSRKYVSFEKAMSIAERAVRFYKYIQSKYDRHIQVLDYISIDSDIEYDLFYFDGRKLK